MNKKTLVFFAALAAGYTLSACNCGSSHPPNTNDGGPDDGGGNYDGGPGSNCLTDGMSCSASSGGVCCSGVCTNAICSVPTFCSGPSASCAVNTDCCSNHCTNGSCSAQQCLD